MKTITASVFVVLLLTACTKENNNKQMHSFAYDNTLVYDDSASLPLNDLGSRTFYGYTGGLYPNGANMPSGTYAQDLLTTSKSIVPIDTFGNPSSTSTGKILFVSLGGSTGGKIDGVGAQAFFRQLK